MNGLNVLGVSSIFTARQAFQVNKVTYSYMYYLVNDIYREFLVIMKSLVYHANGRHMKHKIEKKNS